MGKKLRQKNSLLERIDDEEEFQSDTDSEYRCGRSAASLFNNEEDDRMSVDVNIDKVEIAFNRQHNDYHRSFVIE